MKRYITILLSTLFVLSAIADGAKEPTKHSPIEINKKEFKEKIYNYVETPDKWEYRGDKPAIVDFYATWCGPCHKIAPILNELAEKYGDRLIIYKVDTDKSRSLATDLQISSLPTLLFIPMNGIPKLCTGALSMEQFETLIKEDLLKTNN